MFAIFLSFCIFMQNWGENAPVSAVLHSSQSIFASFTKHFCILHKAFLHSSQSIFAFFTEHFCILHKTFLHSSQSIFASQNIIT